MKKIISLVLALVLISSLLSVTAIAEDEAYVFDKGGFLNEKDFEDLNSSLKIFSLNWGIPTKAVIAEKQVGSELVFDAENAYSEIGMPPDGILLLINGGNDEAAVFASGSAKDFLGDYNLQELSMMMENILTDGTYASAIYGSIGYIGSVFSEKAANLSEDYVPSERLLPRVIDNACILTSTEEKALMEKLDEVSKKHNCDVSLATVEFLDSRAATPFADDWYDYNGYGEGDDDSGILFLISMGERDWAVSTHEYGKYAFTDKGIEILIDRLIDALSDGYYFEAFMSYASTCDEFLDAADSGEPVDVDNIPKGPVPIFFWIICIVIALIAGFAGAGMLKGQLTTVEMQDRADSYAKQNSLKIPDRNELFLFSNVSRSAIPRETKSSSGGGSSSHSSSSGRSHGGSSGKF